MAPRPGPATANRTAIVIGASMAGILAAAALARAGFRITVLDRDQLTQDARPRRGVPQDLHPHILLHRGLTEIERLLPGYRAGLLAAGAVAFDGGRMPWLGEHGWLDTEIPTFEVVSATRPVLETVARERLAALTDVRVDDGTTVRGLRRDAAAWVVQTDGGELLTDAVVDASGRSTRLGHWLPGLDVAAEQLDAQVGYATRHYRERDPLPLRTGAMIFSTPELGMAGVALPVEDRGWLVAAAGFGDRRPTRDEAAFGSFLGELRDPALAQLTSALEPVGEIAVHRQTGNVRRRWDRATSWPRDLLVVGDALCALNPIYGQGITVAAQQAAVLAHELTSGARVDRRLQRRLTAVTEAPWSIATGSDLRQPSCPDQPSTGQRWIARWADSVGRLAATGNVRATRTLTGINHLMTPPAALFHPALLAAVVRGIPARRLPRPPVLDELSRATRCDPRPQAQPPAGPADA